jgi:hypothetical protein
MGALDAAYHTLTRVRAPLLPPPRRVAPRRGRKRRLAGQVCVLSFLRCSPADAAAGPAAAPQSNVTNVAFVITGALFGERVRCSAARLRQPAWPRNAASRRPCRPLPAARLLLQHTHAVARLPSRRAHAR